MGYVATKFQKLTGHPLPGLKDFTGWIRARGYYHLKVADLGLVDRCTHLRGLRILAGSLPRPSYSTPPSGPPPGRAPHQEAPPSASGSQLREAATPSQGADLPPLEEADADDPTIWYSQVVTQDRVDTGAAKVAAFVAVTSLPGSTRSKDLQAVYDYIAARQLPPDNIASPRVKAYYTKLLKDQHRTLSSHILTMIADYHAVCMLKGPHVTSPITSLGIEERLPPLGDYAKAVHQPSNREGRTDVRVRDHHAKTLRVAVWLHRLDMALEPHGRSLWTLRSSRHSQGALLSYLLSPGTGNIQYQHVLTRIMEENREYYQKKRSQLVSWLRLSSTKRTRYLEELGVVTNQLDSTSHLKERKDLECRLTSLRTAILTLEHSIKKREAQLALCRSHEREVDGQQEASSSSSSSSSSEGEDRPPEGEDHAEGAEAAEAAASKGNLTVTPEEERMLLDSEPTEAGEIPTAAMVMGEMA